MMSVGFYAVGLLLVIVGIMTTYSPFDVVLAAIYGAAMFVSGVGLICAGAVIETIKKSTKD